MCGQPATELPPELDPWRNGQALRYLRKNRSALRQFCDRPNSIGALPTEPEPRRLP